jgi:hypothetical protein
VRIYPYSQHDNPKDVSRHIAAKGRKWANQQPGGLAFWALLSRLINEEPAIERDRITLATLVPIGIEKGRSFDPDERQKKILEEASLVGELMARTNGYSKRFEGAVTWPGKHWEYALHMQNTDQEAPNYTQLDERWSWFYEAIGVVESMMGRTVGAVQLYLAASKDSNGDRRSPSGPCQPDGCPIRVEVPGDSHNQYRFQPQHARQLGRGRPQSADFPHRLRRRHVNQTGASADQDWGGVPILPHHPGGCRSPV